MPGPPRPTLARPALALVAAAAVAAAALAGCATDRPGVTNTLGTLTATAPARLSEAVDAARGAARDLGLLLIRTSHDYQAGSARLKVRSRTGAPVTIAIAPVDSAHVRLRVRYGLTGDAALSQTILAHIQRRLASPAPGDKAGAPAGAGGRSATSPPSVTPPPSGASGP